MNYISNNNIFDYVRINNFFDKSILNKLERISKYENSFKVDYNFYNQANNFDISLDDAMKDISINGIHHGLIYHANQLLNIYNDIEFYVINNDIYVSPINIKLYDFIKTNIYEKDFNFIKNKLIELNINNIKNNNELFIICYIGNLNIGLKLINLLNDYIKIQEFSLCLIINYKLDFNEIKNSINIKNYIIYISKEFGNDIIPTLLAYNNLKELYNIKYIIKLHTKSNEIFLNDLTNFLLSKKLNVLISFKNNNCNCIGPENYKLGTKHFYNSKLFKKYNNYIDRNKTFIGGTIFFCNNEIFDKILLFIKDNNFRQFLFNNLYDTNAINCSNSPVHFLERLFGIMKL